MVALEADGESTNGVRRGQAQGGTGSAAFVS
jgi:hypothetical protein